MVDHHNGAGLIALMLWLHDYLNDDDDDDDNGDDVVMDHSHIAVTTPLT
jgi:hypothetical protein